MIVLDKNDFFEKMHIMKHATLTKVIFYTLSLSIGLISFFTFKLFERPSYSVYDFYQKIFADVGATDIALILVDQASINQMSKSDGQNFPWPREYYGAVANVAEKLKAKALLFDILFTESSRYGVEDDQRLASIFKEVKVPIFLPGPDAGGTVVAPVEVLRTSVDGMGGVHLPASKDEILSAIPSDKLNVK